MVLDLFLAGFWGIVWAGVLQWTQVGRWLAIRRTWITVVVGVGGTLLIALLRLGLTEWLYLCGLFALSSVGLIVRSLYNEHRDERG